MIPQRDLPAFALSPSGYTSVTSAAAVILRCALTAWCSMDSKCACSSLRPRTRAGASAALMMSPKDLLSASMQVLTDWADLDRCSAFFFISLSSMSMSNGSWAIQVSEFKSLFCHRWTLCMILCSESLLHLHTLSRFLWSRFPFFV